MEGNPDSRDHQMTRRFTGEAADLLRRTEQGRQPTSTTAIQNNYSGPLSHVDLTNATNVCISVGEQGTRCLSQECYCQKVELLKQYFVDIHALQTAQQLLEKHGHVSICGAPGDGKTSIALIICEAYQQKRYETVFVENIERFDVDTISKRQSHMLVVFDDIFGSVTFSSNLEKLHKLFSDLNDNLAKTAADTERESKKKKEKKSKGKEKYNEETPIYRLKLVFTSRTYIWKEGCSRLHQYKVELLKTEAILDMTKDCLTVEEKKRMLQSYKSKHPTCEISEKDICSIIDSKHNIFGFPLISKLFFTHAVFQMHNVKFFNHPLTYLRGDLDAIVREESNRSAAIILLILCDGNLNLVSLQSRKAGNVMFGAVKEVVPCCTSTGIAKEINNFTGVYCTVEDHIASFSHSSIYDAAACAVGHLNIVLLLEHCSLKFLYERVRLGKSIQSSDIEDVTNMIYITPQLHQTVVDRLVEGIRQGCFIWSVKHPVLREERIASLLWTEINDNIVEIVQQKDSDSGECFWYLASISESYFLFSKTLEIVVRLGDSAPDLYDCVVACVTHGKLKHLEHLVTVMSLHGGFNVEFSIDGKTLLIMAAETGQSEVFNFLIQKGADISVTDWAGNNCLHYACESGSMPLTTKVVETCPVSINSMNYNGLTPAMFCAKEGCLDILKFLQKKGANLTLTNYYLTNCLHLASENGNLSTVSFCNSLKIFDMNKKETIQMQTPAMMALKGGHYDVYHLLVSEGADLTLTDADNRDYNRDCLMLACEGGNISIVKHVLSMKTCDINRQGGYFKQTPIMMALKGGHYDVYHLLVSEGADLTLTDDNNIDCLMLACKGGNISTVRYVLSKKIWDINRRGGELKKTPIMMALKGGHYDVYHLLVSEGADLTLTDDDNRDCLMFACKGGNINIVKHVLSKKTCDINRRGGELKQTPIMMALKGRHYDVYHLLVSEGADLTLTDDDNRDCLMLACKGGNINIVKHVLSKKTWDINRRGGYFKQTPIMMACEGGHYDVYHLLVSEGADLTLTDDENRDCLMLACEGGNINIVKHVLSKKTWDINRRGGELKQTPIMMALKGGHYDVYHLLVSEGADLTLTDDENTDCLMLACEGGNINIVKHVFSKKTWDINRRGGELKQTPIMMALKGGHYDVYHLLVSEGADLTLTDDNNRDCLMLACEGGNINIVKHVLSKKTWDINRRGGYFKQTPIMMALEGGHHDVYHLLVSEGADLTLTDDENTDCLMLACEGGNINIVKHVLSKKTWDINRRGGELKQTPIMMALKGGHYDVYHLLVSEGSDLTLTDEDNRDCLMLACEGGNINIVKHVLSKKTCDINRRGGELKQTPIMMALKGGHYDVYHLLVSEGSDLTLTDEDNRDCLMLACEGGNINIVKHVLSKKTCDINRRGGELKQTPIMMALEEGHYDVYHLLVSEGSDLTLTDDENTDCLMLACEGGNINIVKHVLSKKTWDINRRGGYFKQTPIMMALKRGHYDVYYLLVSEGADLTLTDDDNRDCLMLACEGGNINVVKHVLSKKTCDINRRGGELKQTPIMMALKGGHYDVYHLLVSEGADLTLTDAANRDCLMLACEGGNISTVRYVLSMKTCDINRRGGVFKQAPIMMACEGGHYDVYHLLVSEGADLTLTYDDNNRDCLMLACEGGNINIVKHVLSKKTCDINRRGGELKQTPIMMACEGGHYDVYHLLVSEGADLTLTDDDNTDCLMLACEGGNINVVKHILSKKTCDINRRGGELKQTPIMMAIEGRHYDVYHLLVSEGADLTLTDAENRDCLMLACEGGNINIVKHVLSMKTCDINRRGGELKQTPIMMAFKGRHYDVYHLLVSEGADLTLTHDDNRDSLSCMCRRSHSYQ
ncbi:serine/threonine-protein phosphatase 6 regulatory ankyrin repeat subunit B-like [Haliotis cracherodii]|uniref:serine/threonine-protein phosphatase 6 regulatory ankyrin repeat subunit B-like n=1 Tax=Haliotis cracherodii TaxID=6455 RepID=UPI0039ED4868